MTSLPRLGGLHLERIPFDHSWIDETTSAKRSEVLLGRAERLQAYRFFYDSNGYQVEGFLIEPKEGGPFPCIISNRGGSKDFGSIDENLLWGSRTGALADAGYLVIASQYSGAGRSEGEDDFGGPQTINDIRRLYDLLAADPRADLSRIGMWGASRGGMMTYLLLREVRWLKAAATLAGSADLRDTTFRPKMKEHYELMFGGAPAECEKRSVLAWVHELPKDVPLLLMHGTADWRVDPLDSLRLAQRCYEEKIPCRFHWFEGGDHRLSEACQESTRTVIAWFDTYVRDLGPLPDLTPHGE
jgi:dipeptidyl aminopeptidase/acylaminoacyl peptidase